MNVTAIGMLAIFALGGYAGAGAASTLLPAATGIVSCTTSGGAISDPFSCSTGYESGQRTLSPYATISASASYPGGFVDQQTGVFAYSVYYLTVDGPDPYAKVIIDFDTRLHQSAVNSGEGFAEILVTAGTDIFTAPNTAYKVICGNPICTDQSTDFAGTLQITTNPGYVSKVDLEITASAGFALDPNSANAYADPYFYIDPSTPDASKYTITLSAGVGNGLAPNAVPEPGAWALMLAGFGLAGAGLRGKRSVSAAGRA